MSLGITWWAARKMKTKGDSHAAGGVIGLVLTIGLVILDPGFWVAIQGNPEQ